MSKPYLVVQVTDGRLGQIFECPTFEGAVYAGVTLATEQSNETSEDIHKELEETTSWESPCGDITIYIAQAEDWENEKNPK